MEAFIAHVVAEITAKLIMRLLEFAARHRVEIRVVRRKTKK